MLEEFAPIPLEIRDVMLFDNEVAPVGGSAGKDNPRARISRENFVVCCTQNWDIRLWPHHHDSMIFKAFEVRTNSGGIGENRGETNGYLTSRLKP
jgi:hypothetical protein